MTLPKKIQPVARPLFRRTSGFLALVSLWMFIHDFPQASWGQFALHFWSIWLWGTIYATGRLPLSGPAG